MREKMTNRAFEDAAAGGKIRSRLLDTLRRTETPQLAENNHSRHALLDTLSNIRDVHFFAQNVAARTVSPAPIFVVIPSERSDEGSLFGSGGTPPATPTALELPLGGAGAIMNGLAVA